ncbi:MAG: universal stress protein [Deltaproteobacteria bacterium]|nr:universal stress protein [Deltaproteobacteria bacterium]
MAINFKKILFCTDFSEDADNALSTALDLAKRYQARFYVLHVLHSVYQSMPDSCEEPGKDGGGPIFSPEQLEKGTQKLKERYEPKMGALKTNYEFQVVCGVPFLEIIRFARAQNVDCIVLGAAGTSAIKRITFGSTAENVARRAHCTVMIIRVPEKEF